MKKQNISTFAASTAFFFFLSIVPMLIMVCTIIPYTPLTEENLVEAVTDLTPDQVDGLAESLISDIYDKSAGGAVRSPDSHHMVGVQGSHGADAGAECGQ